MGVETSERDEANENGKWPGVSSGMEPRLLIVVVTGAGPLQFEGNTDLD